MHNKKDIKLSVNINKIDNEMINFLLNHYNKNSLTTVRKTTLLRNLIYKDFVEVNKQTFDDLEIDINNETEVIKASKDLELINV